MPKEYAPLPTKRVASRKKITLKQKRVSSFSHSTHFSHMSEPILPTSHLYILFCTSVATPLPLATLCHLPLSATCHRFCHLSHCLHPFLLSIFAPQEPRCFFHTKTSKRNDRFGYLWSFFVPGAQAERQAGRGGGEAEAGAPSAPGRSRRRDP